MTRTRSRPSCCTARDPDIRQVRITRFTNMVAVCFLCCCMCCLWWARHICCVWLHVKYETLCSWCECVALYYCCDTIIQQLYPLLYCCGCTPVLHSTVVLYWSLIVRLVPVISPSITWVRREYNTVPVFSPSMLSVQSFCVFAIKQPRTLNIVATCCKDLL